MKQLKIILINLVIGVLIGIALGVNIGLLNAMLFGVVGLVSWYLVVKP